MDTNSKVSKNINIPILMLSCFMSVGTGLGISLGVAFDNIPVGISIGSGAGITLGMFFINILILELATTKKAMKKVESKRENLIHCSNLLSHRRIGLSAGLN